MFTMGWEVKADNNGHFGKLGNYTARIVDEDWVERVSIPVSHFSFETFRRYWLVYYPKLKVRKPSYDTCVVCFEYTCTLYDISREANVAKLTLDEITFID